MSLFVGSEVQVNTYTDGDQKNSSTIALPDGGYVTVWQSYYFDGVNGYPIFMQRFDVNGDPVGSETTVFTSTLLNNTLPKIAALDQGGWVVAWQTNPPGNSDTEIYQTQFDAQGDPVTDNAIQVNTFATGIQTSHTLTALSDGGWVVTWESELQDGSFKGLYQQKFDIDGMPVGTETMINTYTVGTQQRAVVTGLEEGKWVVAWESDASPDGSTFEIFQQLFDADGAPLGPETHVNTITSATQDVPAITALSNGNWVTTWRSSTADPDTSMDLALQLFDASGNPIGGEVKVNTYQTGNQLSATVSALFDGGWLVTWKSIGQDGDSGGIYQQRFTETGNLSGPEIHVSTQTVGSQASPVVAVLPTGGWVVVWVSVGQDGDSNGIFQQVYGADGNPDGGEIQVNSFTTGSQQNPSVTVLADGGFVVTWDSIGQDGDVFGVFHKTFHFGNVAPESLDAVVSTNPGMAYTFSAASFGFSDADGDSLGAVIIDAADLGDGDLTYDGAAVTLPVTIDIANLGKLVWTPPAMAGTGHGTLSYRVVDDGGTVYGGSDTDATAATLTLNVAPFVNSDIPVQSPVEDSPFTYSLPSNLFGDLEGDSLTYSAKMPDGSDLPDWLDFNGTTFSGTPENGDVGMIEIVVTATDSLNASVSNTLTLNVTNTNDVPEVDKGLQNKLTAPGLNFSYAIPADAFKDIDGDTLAYVAGQSVVGDLPTWLKFDGTTFTGTPDAGDVGIYTIFVTANDPSNEEITTNFTIEVGATNQAPTSTAIAAKTIAEKSLFVYALPDGTFTDPEEQPLSFTITYDGGAKPAWLNFDEGTRTFSGAPDNAAVGDHVIELTASDGVSQTVQSFTLTVTNVNDAPTVVMAPTNTVTDEDVVFEYLLASNTFADVDIGDQLTYSFSKGGTDELPAWLQFDAAAFKFFGTPDNNDVGIISVKLTATDLAGASASAIFDIEVMNTNDAPEVANQIESRVVKTGIITNFTPPADIFSDVDLNDSLDWSVSNPNDPMGAFPPWFGFNSSTHQFTFLMPDATDVGVYTVDVTATDMAGEPVTETFTIVVSTNFTGPIVLNPIAPQTFMEDAPLEFAVPFETFIGLDGTSAITYSAKLVDGSDLPAWLHISQSGVFTSDPGFPGNDDVDTYQIRVFANEDGAVSFTDFDLTIANVNDAPYLKDAQAVLGNALEDTPYVFTLDDLLTGFDDVDANDGLSVSNVTADHGMVTDNLDGTYTFMPAQDYNGPVVLSYTVNDMNMGAIQTSLDLTVDPVNDAPEGTDKTFTILEDGSHIFTVADFGFSDPLDNDGSQLQSIKISNIAGGGFLVLDAGGITGPVLVKAGDIITAAEIETLVWQPGPNNNGMNFGSFSFQVIDDGGTANGGVDTDQTANTIAFDVTAVNDDAPALTGAQAALPDATEDVNYFITPAALLSGFTDPDMPNGDTLTVQNVVSDHGIAAKQSNGNWAVFPQQNYSGIVNLTYEVKDSTGNIVAATHSFNVVEVNDAPTIWSGLADQLVVKETDFSFTPPLDAFEDIETPLDQLKWTATLADNSVLPSWLHFDENSHEFTGNAPSGTGDVMVKVTATDTGTPAKSVTDTFTLSVAEANAAPVVANAVGNQSVNEDAAFLLDFAAVFSDSDLNPLTLSATLAGGAVLPDWLSFEGGFLTGTPQDGDVGTISVVVTATDGLDSVSETFDIVVNPVNDAPVGTPKTITIQEDATYQLTLADFGYTDPSDAVANAFFGVEILATAGQGSLTKLDGSAIALPVVLTVAEILGGLVWKPAADANGDGLGSFTFKVIDDGGTADGGINKDTVAKTITFNVTPVNDAPQLTGVPGVIAGDTEDSSILILAASLLAGFTDDDMGDTFSVANLTVNHGTLEDKFGGTWLFTPDQDYNGPVTVSYDVQDNHGAATPASLSFNLTPVNDAPTVFAPLADRLVVIDAAFSFTPPLDSFKDVDAGDEVLNWTATLDDDSPLPDWLGFNATTHEFFRAMPGGSVGELMVKITATDNGTPAKFVTDIFKLTVALTNEAPVVDNPIANQTVNEDVAFSLDVSSVFSDPDGNELSYSAKLADGSDLPTWLHWVGSTLTGTPENGDTGMISVVVTATDGDKSVTSDFNLTVNPVNDAPQGSDLTIAIAEDSTHAFTVADFGYSDDEGDAFAGILVTGVTGGVLTLNGVAVVPGAQGAVTVEEFANLVFTPTENAYGPAAGSLSFKVVDKGDTANGGSNTDPDANVITFDIGAVNDAPTLANTLLDQILTEDSNFIVTIPANAFDDVDMGDTMTLTATLENGDDLPTWMSFDGTSFTGTPDNDAVGEISVKVTATDAAGASVSDVFKITVNNVNDAPIVFKALGDKLVVKDTAFSITPPLDSFKDVDVGDALTWSATLADDTALPTWLGFNLTSHEFTGSPGQGEVGFYDIKVTATDKAGLKISDIFRLTVAESNVAPVLDNPVAPQSINEDAVFNLVVPANTFSDADGNDLTLEATLADGSDLPAWLHFDAVTNTFSGTPENGDVGVISVKLSATDGAETASSIFDITVVNTNDAPTVANEIGPQPGTPDVPFNFTLPTNIFADVDVGDTLTLTATLANGNPLAGTWLSFDGVKFTGTPGMGDIGTLSVTVFATDAAGAVVSDTFDIVTDLINDAPSSMDAHVAVLEDKVFSFGMDDFIFSDPNGDAFKSVIIEAFAGKGTLLFNNAAVEAGQEIAVAELGKLTFQSVENDFGDDYAQLTYRVVDDGGNDLGGIDTDPLAHILSLDVSDVTDFFRGNRHRENKVGTDGHDVFNLKAGNDKMTGKEGSDLFIFKTRYDRDLIRDFDAVGDDHDVLNLHGLKSVKNWGDLKHHHMEQKGDNVVINGRHGDVVTLKGVDIDDLDKSDFIF